MLAKCRKSAPRKPPTVLQYTKRQEQLKLF